MDILEKAYTFDDVLLVPSHSTILPKDVNLKTSLTKNICLNIPLVSAAMDTVTEAKLAISMSQEGGVGVIHKNMTFDLQALAVEKVKRHESGIVNDPVEVSPHLYIKDVLDIINKHKISSLPVVENGEVIGIITNRDLRFERNLNKKVFEIMTPKNKLITVKEGVSIEDARDLMHKHKIERVLVINDNWNLKGLITVKDILMNSEFPNANKDEHGRLIVGAAVGVGKDTEIRVEKLIDSQVDFIVIDTAHGHHQMIIDKVKYLKKNYPNLDIIAGNIATYDAAKNLADVGVDGVKVGIGPGSICTTRIIAGVGVPQLTAINSVYLALKDFNIPIIADGGIRYSGDITKALAAGASSVMIGSMFAGTDEAPGDIELYQGRSYKSYRGMGSIGAMNQGSADRYFQDESLKDKLVPEGIEGRVPYKGPITNIIKQLIGGLSSGMGYLGCKDIKTLNKNAKFVEITSAGMHESHVHDIQITKEPPNYHTN